MQSKRTHLESLRGQCPEGCRKSWNVFILTYANPSDPWILSFILCNVNDHITCSKELWNWRVQWYCLKNCCRSFNWFFQTVKFLISRRYTKHSSLFTIVLKLSDDSFIPSLLNFSFFLLNYTCHGFTTRSSEWNIFSLMKYRQNLKQTIKSCETTTKYCLEIVVSGTLTKCNV